eukprot:48413-Amphidinium_carterae.1
MSDNDQCKSLAKLNVQADDIMCGCERMSLLARQGFQDCNRSTHAGQLGQNLSGYSTDLLLSCAEKAATLT